MKIWMIVVFALCLAVPATAAVQTQEITYTIDDQPFNGFIAYDDALEGQRPGVLVVHEWWGHNQYARSRARMLAELGYIAMSIDMYGDGKTAAHPDQAGEFAGEVRENMDTAKERFLAGLDVLKSQAQTDPERLAAIGYCFGGGVVLNMARMGVDLNGVASFHGSLDPAVEAQPGDVKAAVLVEHGADDSFIPQETIDAFKAEMERLGVDYTFHSYEGAKHSFTNPDADAFAEKFGMGIAYNAQADQKSWQALQVFLNRIFSQ